MANGGQEAAKAAGAVAAGAGVGAAIYGAVGGIGLAAGGAAVGITLGPFLLIGGGLGAAGYGLHWLGKQVGAAAGGPNTPPSSSVPTLGSGPASPSRPDSGWRVGDP